MLNLRGLPFADQFDGVLQFDFDSAAPPEQAWRRRLDSHANILKEFSVTFREAVQMVYFLPSFLHLFLVSILSVMLLCISACAFRTFLILGFYSWPFPSFMIF